MEDNDEPITLSAHALAALAEFNAERDAHQSKFEELKAQAEDDAQLSMTAFTEDWNESQFWYSEETAEVLANELLEASNPKTRIGVVSAPSVFVALRNILRKLPASDRPKIVLLEHDPRFGVFSEFVYYDFQQPLKLPNELKGSLDCIICDPPFLSEDCQTKAALTTRWLLKASESSSPKPRVIVCTGERMKDLVTRVYRPLGVLATTYEPRHARGLSNEFYCYANFECSSWVWKP
ncbi:N6-adenine methyltransferase [Metarhizium robertsii]|uniref:Protein-lysine N-methyltransferase EFM5 n=1 Tax=Metarhizium robertsii TaxID=568076 RepID=A0A0A1V8J5_9HYPO|nr:N6-adenine methyltransferase [Metarhizium robertsii]